MAKNSKIVNDNDSTYTRVKQDGARGYVYFDLDPAHLPIEVKKMVEKRAEVAASLADMDGKIVQAWTKSLESREKVPEGRFAQVGYMFGKWSACFPLLGAKATKGLKNAI